MSMHDTLNEEGKIIRDENPLPPPTTMSRIISTNPSSFGTRTTGRTYYKKDATPLEERIASSTIIAICREVGCSRVIIPGEGVCYFCRDKKDLQLAEIYDEWRLKRIEWMNLLHSPTTDEAAKVQLMIKLFYYPEVEVPLCRRTIHKFLMLDSADDTEIIKRLRPKANQFIKLFLGFGLDR